MNKKHSFFRRCRCLPATTSRRQPQQKTIIIKRPATAVEFCDDTMLDICAFLSRAQLATLELASRRWHLAVASDGLRVLHRVSKKLNVQAEHQMQQQQQQPAEAGTLRMMQSDGSGNSETVTTAETTTLANTPSICYYTVCEKGFSVEEVQMRKTVDNGVLYRPRSPSELPPRFVRCPFVFIRGPLDEGLLDFLESVAHIFMHPYKKDEYSDWLYIFVSLQALVPQQRWDRLLALMHSFNDLDFSIDSALFDQRALDIFAHRNQTLQRLNTQLKSHEIDPGQHRNECKLLLRETRRQLAFFPDANAINEPTGMPQQHQSEEKHFVDGVDVGGPSFEALSQWLHCKNCHKCYGEQQLLNDEGNNNEIRRRLCINAVLTDLWMPKTVAQLLETNFQFFFKENGDDNSRLPIIRHRRRPISISVNTTFLHQLLGECPQLEQQFHQHFGRMPKDKEYKNTSTQETLRLFMQQISDTSGIIVIGRRTADKRKEKCKIGPRIYGIY